MKLPDEWEKVSKYFTLHDALYLPRWKRMATWADGLSDAKLYTIFKFLREYVDPIREFVDSPMIVHCCFRPPEYNEEVGGAKGSAHLADQGFAAIDFHFQNYGCDFGRNILVDHLEDFGVRMEDRLGSGWIHLDNKPVPPGGKRFFRP